MRLIPEAARRAFVERTVREWYRANVVEVYEGVPDEDPMGIVLGEHDGWDEGFHDDLSRVFGEAALEGSSDLLEGTIGDYVELIVRNWDGNVRGF